MEFIPNKSRRSRRVSVKNSSRISSLLFMVAYILVGFQLRELYFLKPVVGAGPVCKVLLSLQHINEGY